MPARNSSKGLESLARYWLKARRILAQRVLHTDDSAHSIALGTGIAMFVTFLPLIGFQTVISVGVAALLRANKVVCIPIVWITNVFTIVPIYGACLGLGRLVLSKSGPSNETALLATLESTPSAGIFELAYWESAWQRTLQVGIELWVGCFIVATVTSVASYFLARWGVSTYRERRRQRILRRNLRRSNVGPGVKLQRREPA